MPPVWLTTGIKGFQGDLTRPKEVPEHHRGARMSPRKRLMVAECTKYIRKYKVFLNIGFPTKCPYLCSRSALEEGLGTPRATQRDPRGSQEDLRGSLRGPKGSPGRPQETPKRPQGTPGNPRETPGDSKETPGDPRGTQRGTQRSLRGPKGRPRDIKRTKFYPKRTTDGSKLRYSNVQ